jgi:hypothetical protein
LILSDALRHDAAVQGMGFLGHLVETRHANLENNEAVWELPWWGGYAACPGNSH